MKAKKLTVYERTSASGIWTITLDNCRYQQCFSNAVQKMLELFITDEELYFGFCRTDGMHLSTEHEKALKNKIPSFFMSNGTIEDINEYLSVARMQTGKHEYSFIPSVFDYYLDTVLFNPKISWEKFKEFYSKYQEHRVEDIVSGRYAEIVFFYFDSGDLSICFDPKSYDPCKMKSIINELFLE